MKFLEIRGKDFNLEGVGDEEEEEEESTLCCVVLCLCKVHAAGAAGPLQILWLKTKC